NSKRGSEFNWEREDYIKSKYPQLFVDRTVNQLVKSRDEISIRRGYYENRDLSSDSDLESTAWSGPRDSGVEDTGGSGVQINA
ncbi:hypothetical protein Tco_0432186, partial [Tanacetum coccineum]